MTDSMITDDNNAKLRILPIGGLGEIGLNMMAVVWEGDAIVIDSGLMFPDYSMPGVDLVIPDIEMLLEQEWNILGVVLTHGHEDHIGALPFLLQKVSVPIYATNFTMGLIEHKLTEYKLLDQTARAVVSPDTALELGPFRIDFIAMCHSVADGVGLAIATPEGVIVHTGDFKLDPTPIDGRVSDLEKMAWYGDRSVLLLMSDSTNVEIEGGAGSEISIRPVLEELFGEATGRILLATFSSNIHRIQQTLDLAAQFGRKVIPVGRSMETNIRIASERGFLRIPDGIMRELTQLEGLADSEVTILSTGSQGEPMSTLSLMASERHKYLKVKQDDMLILSSRFIPGNERAINYIINEFSRQGARVEYEKIRHVHVSGHAGREELRTILRTVRPRYFMPVHGEYRHLLQHARLAMNEGIEAERIIVATDGDLVGFSDGEASVMDRKEAARVFVDGKTVGEVGNAVLRDRRVLSEVGVVTLAVVINEETGELMAGPQVATSGVTFQETEADLVEGICGAVQRRIEELAPATPEDWETHRDEIRLAARRYINGLRGRKPTVQTMIVKA